MKTDQAKPNAYHARTWKLGKLTEAQRQSLIGWLREDGLTYAAARQRLLTEMGLKVSVNALCRFWQRNRLPDRAAYAAVDSDVLLDVVIKSAGPVRVTVKRKGNGVTLQQQPCS